ncbi:hypothetical protein RZN22_17685 [Bacillaceae bacterium S4-13-58]
MKKLVITLLGIFLVFTNISQVFAYSYGDPNEEAVAEVYKKMVTYLNEDPPNFQSATEIFNTVKEELDMHMGTEPAETVLTHLNNKDKDLVIQDMQKVLVLNIARRLESIDKGFEDFDTSKKLLAKSFATYKALAPVIESQDPEADQQLRDAFDAALESLGNPGLFGVGEKEQDKELFLEKKEVILVELQEQFNMPSIEVGHFNDSNENLEESNVNTNDWIDLSDIKNWIPIIVLVVFILGVVIYVNRKRKQK